jgi:hypothetical protein
MINGERIQALIHALDIGAGSRWLRWFLLAVAVLALAVFYDLMAYRSFSAPEAMDAAQVARNLAGGRGFSTDCIRPFSIYLVRQHNLAAHPDWLTATNADPACLDGPHPDLANAPLYPAVLAGLMKLHPQKWPVDLRQPFWSAGGRFLRYRPEFEIAIFNQILLLAVVALTFLLARKLFDALAAWLAAALTLGSELLWRFSVSGLSTMLVLVIFLGLALCLVKLEELGRAPVSAARRQFVLAILAGLLTGAGMMTRYSFGWLVIPVIVFLALFGGVRRTSLAVAAFLTFAVAVAPWMIRNLAVSGTLFGTAGYAVAEGTSVFPGAQLMHSLNPDLNQAHWLNPYFRKLIVNVRPILQGDLPQLGGGWIAILFFAGLLLGLRNLAARRLRYFTMMCLGVFVVAQALGRTPLSDLSPEFNSENLLVLLTPLVVIFGVAFFLTLLNQMKTPTSQVRHAVIGLMVLIMCQPLIAALLPPKASPVAWPPYYPPEIQKFSGWMNSDELMMSDVPWAVAWYGDRPCVWTTANPRNQFFALNDELKHVSGLYLSLITIDEKLFTQGVSSGQDSWASFVLQTVVANSTTTDVQSPSRYSIQIPTGFPLRYAPYGLSSGLYLADRPRWLGQ